MYLGKGISNQGERMREDERSYCNKKRSSSNLYDYFMIFVDNFKGCVPQNQGVLVTVIYTNELTQIYK